jgi:type IV secretion system protein VirB11
MTAKNISSTAINSVSLATFWRASGLTEIAVNRPGELYTKINGVWEQHAVPLSYEDCYNFAVHGKAPRRQYRRY